MSKLFSSERKSQTMPVLRGRGSLMQAKLQQFNTMDTSLTLNMGNWCTPLLFYFLSFCDKLHYDFHGFSDSIMIYYAILQNKTKPNIL